MENKKNSMMASAMNYAVPLGLFWCFNYLFIILGDYSEFCKYINSLLKIGTPILYYILVCKYRDEACNGKLDYGNCVLFSLLLFFFASIFETILICLHIYILNPGYVAQFAQQVQATTEALYSSKMQNKEAFDNVLKVYIKNIRELIIISNLMANILIGLFFSLIFGYFISKKRSN